MALYKEPVTALLAVIERENDVTLDPADYDFLNPTPATPPEGSSAAYNTKVTIKANNVAAPFAGEIDVFYNRLSLEDLGNMVDMSIRSAASETAHDLIPSLNRRFGLTLTPDDLVDEATTDQGGYRTVTLRATATSLGWIGQTEVSIAEGDLLLDDHLVSRTLGGLNYPTEYPSKPFAQFYSYWRDFSEFYDDLVTIETGDPIGLSLVSVLNEVTGDPWQATGAGDYSLGNAQITYAGPTSDTGVANVDYTNVIIVALDLGTCLGMTGDLVIHFSPPVDPSEV